MARRWRRWLVGLLGLVVVTADTAPGRDRRCRPAVRQHRLVGGRALKVQALLNATA
jgi:hypothetical protein